MLIYLDVIILCAYIKETQARLIVLSHGFDERRLAYLEVRVTTKVLVILLLYCKRYFNYQVVNESRVYILEKRVCSLA